MKKTTLVIAEAGVNHNGSAEMALALVDAAAAAGADVVKFQTFKSELVISTRAEKAEYQKATTGTGENQLEMVRKLELDHATHHKLVERARARGIEFLSTPFDAVSVEFLVATLGLKRIKIPSGEITNGPLIVDVASRQVPVILSTGMATIGEIETALGALAHGYLGKPPASRSPADFRAAFRSSEGQAALQRNVVLLHCTTEYPAPDADCNLRAMDSMRAAFGLPVGYSDHTSGIAIALAAVARGAAVIEKHFTLDSKLPGPDHRASLEPDQLTAMVQGIRSIDAALGDGIKRPQQSELKNLPIARKSLVAARAIKRGERFSPENVTPKRPGTGLSPMMYWDVLGRPAPRDYEADEILDLATPAADT